MMAAPTWAMCFLLLAVGVSGAAAQQGAEAEPPPKAAPSDAKREGAASPPAQRADTQNTQIDKPAEARVETRQARADVRPDAPAPRRVRVRSTVSVIDPRRDLHDLRDIISQMRSHGAASAKPAAGARERARPVKQGTPSAKRRAKAKAGVSQTPPSPRQVQPVRTTRRAADQPSAREGRVGARERDAREVRRARRRDLRGVRGTRSPGPMNHPPPRHRGSADH